MALSGELCFLSWSWCVGFGFQNSLRGAFMGLLTFVDACLCGSGCCRRLGVLQCLGGFDLRVGLRGFGFN